MPQNHATILAGEGSSGLTAWDAVSGRIPILWTASVEKAGVKREDYEKWLRWYGASVKDYMWKPQRLYVEAAVADAAAKRKRARRAVGGGSGGSAGRKPRKQGSKEAKRRQ